MVEEKHCRICSVLKPLTEFHRRSSGRYRTECNPCRSSQSAARRYNVTVGDIEKLKASQNNSCAICGTHASEIPHKAFIHNPLVIDHDHATGKVRGLLCPTCNSMLGHAMDNPTLLLSAAQYLQAQ